VIGDAISTYHRPVLLKQSDGANRPSLLIKKIREGKHDKNVSGARLRQPRNTNPLTGCWAATPMRHDAETNRGTITPLLSVACANASYLPNLGALTDLHGLLKDYSGNYSPLELPLWLIIEQVWWRI